MKRLGDLTVEDLEADPVWRYEDGAGAETLVVADRRDTLSRSDEEIFLGVTEFVLPDGSRHAGFCFPVDGEGLEYLQPVIVTRSGHVRFWFDGAVAPESLDAQWRALGKKADEVFPVSFRCLVPVDGRMVSGLIPGVETPASAAPPPRLAEPHAAAASSPHRRLDHSSPRRASRTRRLFAETAGLLAGARAPRRRVEMSVDFDQEGSRGVGVTGDVSSSGMYVHSTRPANVGPALNLTLSLPGGRKLHLKGRVVRGAGDSAPATGFGVRLTDKSSEYEEFLARLLEGR